MLAAATYRCQCCKIIIQIIEMSPSNTKAIYCPYCGNHALEPTTVILC